MERAPPPKRTDCDRVLYGDHMLLECKNFKDLKDQLTLIQRDLGNDREGNKKVIKFVRSIRGYDLV